MSITAIPVLVLLVKRVRVAGSFGPVNYVVLGAYLTVLVAMGFYFAKRGRSTDDFLAVVLIGGAFVALGIIIGDLDGGFSELVSVAIENRKFNLAHLNWDWTSDALIVVILGAIFTNSLVPYTTDQAVIQRYLTTPDERQAAKAIWLNGFLAIFAGVLFLLVCTGLFVFYKANPQRLVPLERTDQIFALFIARQMPPGLAGLVIAGIFAAAMSTLDSSMHSISTAVTTDFVRRFIPYLSESKYLLFARCLTIAMSFQHDNTNKSRTAIRFKYLQCLLWTRGHPSGGRPNRHTNCQTFPSMRRRMTQLLCSERTYHMLCQ